MDRGRAQVPRVYSVAKIRKPRPRKDCKISCHFLILSLFKSTEAFIEALEIHAQLSSYRKQMRAKSGVELTTSLSRDVWVLIAMHLSVPTALNVLGMLNSYFNALIRTSSRFWFAKFTERWGGAVHARTVAQFCSALGD